MAIWRPHGHHCLPSGYSLARSIKKEQEFFSAASFPESHTALYASLHRVHPQAQLLGLEEIEALIGLSLAHTSTLSQGLTVEERRRHQKLGGYYLKQVNGCLVVKTHRCPMTPLTFLVLREIMMTSLSLISLLVKIVNYSIFIPQLLF